MDNYSPMPGKKVAFSNEKVSHHLSHDVLLLVQVVDAQLTQIWHKWSGVVSRAHRINRHRPKLEIDTLELILICRVQELLNQPVS